MRLCRKHLAAAMAVAAFGVFSSTTCAQTIVDQSDRNLAEEVLVDVVTAVSAGMFDPLSAQFAALQHSPVEPVSHVVCGLVNGKNLDGAYTGFQIFAYDPKSSILMLFREAARSEKASSREGMLRNGGDANDRANVKFACRHYDDIYPVRVPFVPH